MSQTITPSPNLHHTLTQAIETLLAWNVKGVDARYVLRRYFIAGVLKQYQGNQCRAARRLKVHRNTMSRYVEELQLDDYVRQLVGKSGPQMKLFKKTTGGVPARAGFAQDAVVLHKNPQGKTMPYQQVSNRLAV